MNIRAMLDSVFQAALASVNPRQVINSSLRLDGDQLTIRTETEQVVADLSRYNRLLALGVGKAAAGMATAVEDMLGDRIDGGLVVTKHGFGEPLRRIELIEAGHPVPDDNSVVAGRRMAKLARNADAQTLVLFLVSGGGSALLTTPFENSQVSLSLDDIQRTTQLLLDCGADITEINCLRKHMSLLKGGRLAKMLAPATTFSLILSDVVGNRLDSIASGPTVPDPSTFDQMLLIIERYGLADRLPASVAKLLKLGQQGVIEDTPADDDPAFGHVRNILVGNNAQALEAAVAHARTLGVSTRALTSQLSGEAREVAVALFAEAKAIPDSELPVLMLAGGETTVTLDNDHGKGGRNQEMALAFLAEMARNPDTAEITLLSAATDGNDGPTDAAGAWASRQALSEARAVGLDPDDYLRRHDAYAFFERLGQLYKTGPTRTNVGDIQLIYIDRKL
ncbi:MAG: glycerate kinase [Candidatus Cloacimonetes bacterium]|nr:glycerate kinase [Candidatus Cloacimonadota bacterium]